MIYDAAVIGGGPGGYVAAIRSAQLGMKTCLIERNKVGGTCLNAGCIPTKFLLTASGKFASMKELDRYGIILGDYKLDMVRMISEKDAVVNRLVKGVQYLIKKNKVDFLQGNAVLAGKNEIRIETGEETARAIAENIIIATGTQPAMPDLFKHDGKLVCTSDEALDWDSVPDKLVIIGGGVIGCEFATIFANLGSKVTIIEILPNIAASFDPELSKLAAAKLKSIGVEIITDARVQGIIKDSHSVKAVLEDGRSYHADRMLVSIGRRACTGKIGLEAAGVIVDPKKGKILVDNTMKTNVENIYAIGDVCSSPLDLAHVAMKEGMVAADNIAGFDTKMDYRCVPNCVFANPEFASVGYTAEEAVNSGMKVKIGKFNFIGNGKAVSMGESDGFVKVVIEEKTDKILGAQITGPHATDLIAELAVLVQNETTSSRLADTIHAHPTLAEAVWEAVENAYGRAIHG